MTLLLPRGTLAGRKGPRPLPLHLLIAGQMWASALLAQSMTDLTRSKKDWTPSANTPTGPAQTSSGPDDHTDSSAPPGETREEAAGTVLAAALQREIGRRAGVFLDGINRYRSHPYRRNLSVPPVVWSEGSSRLHDFGVGNPASGRAVLVVPSLINRGYILDLAPDNSLMRWLAAEGFRPLLLEWGPPGQREAGYTLTDIIAGRLERATAAAAHLAGGPLPVMGYCMGGTLVAALAHRRPDLVSAAVFLGTPWDFHADGMEKAVLQSAMLRPLFHNLTKGMPMSVDWLQAMFTGIDPLVALRKFTAFAAMDADSDRARAFVALEDWLNDGVDLPGPIARACFEDWYGRNDTAKGRWMIAGAAVDPSAISVQSLHVIALRDRLVPPASSLALAACMEKADVRKAPLGHIGMIAGRSAKKTVWPMIADWLNTLRPH